MTLVSVAELADRIGDGTAPLVLDARWNLVGPDGHDDYRAGHIPGAVWVDLDRELAGPAGDGGRHPLPSSEVFVAAMQRVGVEPDAEVIVCDGGSTLGAARLWWLLLDHGHTRVRVLDGGFAAWQQAGKPVETGEVAPTPGSFVGAPGHLPRVGVDDLLDEARAIVDVRAPERFTGEREPIDPVAGHIPGAVNLPASESFDAGRFRPAAELADHFAVVPSGAAAYCGSGVTAAQTILALHLAGREDVALYPGSWSEWITDPARGVARG